MMIRTFALAVFSVCVLIGQIAPVEAQSPPVRTIAVPGSQGIFLVFPFENDGASPRLDWLCEGLEELTIQRLSAAGQKVFTHAGRASELDRYGLPRAARFSHATMLRVGAELDADFVILGKFSSDGNSLTVESRVLRVNPTTLSAPVRETASLDSLMELHARVTWKLLAENDRHFPLNLAEFSRLQRPLRLDAFEHYARGLLAGDDDGRMRELRESARLEPDWPEPAFALGQALFRDRLRRGHSLAGACACFEPTTPKRFYHRCVPITAKINRTKRRKFFSPWDRLKKDLVAGRNCRKF
jgi:TolB-like protein